MAARLTTEAALAAVAKLAETDPSENIEAALRPLLAHKSNFVIGKAVALAEARNFTGLAPELVKAFPNFMEDCVKRDPGCSAKLAIVNCLLKFEEAAWDVFLAGVRHVQKEPAFGGPIDTAATLRAICGRALIAMGHHDAFRWHALLIADPEPMTRMVAVETLAGVPDERAELLLRTKIAREPHHGAREPEVTIEMAVFEGLMKSAPDASFNLVAGFLRDEDLERVRGAALALGESRRSDAFDLLCERWRWGADWELREALALAIALVRSDAAFDFLLEAVEKVPEEHATGVIEALALYRDTPVRAQAVKEVVEARTSRRLAQIYRKAFEPDAETTA